MPSDTKILLKDAILEDIKRENGSPGREGDILVIRKGELVFEPKAKGEK